MFSCELFVNVQIFLPTKRKEEHIMLMSPNRPLFAVQQLFGCICYGVAKLCMLCFKNVFDEEKHIDAVIHIGLSLDVLNVVCVSD